MKRITFVVVGLLAVLAFSFYTTKTETEKTYKVAEHKVEVVPVFD